MAEYRPMYLKQQKLVTSAARPSLVEVEHETVDVRILEGITE